jgi:hypothetical protein
VEEVVEVRIALALMWVLTLGSSHAPSVVLGLPVLVALASALNVPFVLAWYVSLTLEGREGLRQIEARHEEHLREIEDRRRDDVSRSRGKRTRWRWRT